MNRILKSKCPTVAISLVLAGLPLLPGDTVRFTVVAADQETARIGFSFFNGSKAAPLGELSTVSRSGELVYDGKGREFFITPGDMNPGPVEKPRQPEEKLCKVVVDGKVTRALVVLAPLPVAEAADPAGQEVREEVGEKLDDPEDAEGSEEETGESVPDEGAARYQAIVIDDSTTNFSWGTTRLVNVTGMPLQVSVDGKSVVVSDTPATLDLAEVSNKFEVTVAPEEDPEELVYSSIWTRNENERKLVVISGTGGRDTFAVSVISEDRLASGR